MKSAKYFLTVALITFVFSSIGFAQSKTKTSNPKKINNQKIYKQQNNNQRINWIDANGDGICDNFDKNSKNQKFNNRKNIKKNCTGNQSMRNQNKTFGNKKFMKRKMNLMNKSTNMKNYNRKTK